MSTLLLYLLSVLPASGGERCLEPQIQAPVKGELWFSRYSWNHGADENCLIFKDRVEKEVGWHFFVTKEDAENGNYRQVIPVNFSGEIKESMAIALKGKIADLRPRGIAICGDSAKSYYIYKDGDPGQKVILQTKGGFRNEAAPTADFVSFIDRICGPLNF